MLAAHKLQDVYELPLGAVTSVDTANLFAVGRCADGDRLAGASLRVMGTAFVTGQASGVAAAEVARHGRIDDVGRIRAALLEQEQLIDGGELPDPVPLVNR